MSTNPPPPPDRPTERLQPQPPPRQPPPAYEERVVAPATDLNVVLVRLEDAIDSMRTGLMIVGVIAVAALGVAIYGLVKEDDSGGGSRSGLASDSRVSKLDDRVDRLSRQVQGLRSGGDAGGGDTAELQDRIEALERTAKTLADRPSTDPQQAIDELSGRLDDLANDVEELKSAQQPAP
jgi:outer membrane murein-binding lipoprotein Lpp